LARYPISLAPTLPTALIKRFVNEFCSASPKLSPLTADCAAELATVCIAAFCSALTNLAPINLGTVY